MSHFFLKIAPKILIKSSLLTFFLFSLVCISFGAEKPKGQSLSKEAITSPRCNTFTFDATGSYDPDNEKLSFFWDFGDGETSTQPMVEHTYKKSGDYYVTLTISDNSGLECSTGMQTQLIRANMPPYAMFQIKDQEACTDQAISFDASQSGDPDGNKIEYSWDFGDGTSQIGPKKITKTYTKGGTYQITLKVNDGTNTSCASQTHAKKLIVNEAPIADAGEEEILRCVNDESDMLISFDGSNSRDTNNDKLSYTWEFGDGETQEGIKVTHQYKEIDNYQVKLIVKDDSHLSCGTNVDFVTVRLNKAPKANAGEDITACPKEIISFDGSNSYVHKKGTANVKWFFGDGQTADGYTVEHSYDKPGQYQASLTINNELNSMCPASRDTRLVSINSAPAVSITSVDSVCLGSPIHFDASSAADPDSDALEYYWSFGDGTILKGGPKAMHEYKEGGNYRVTVIVDDGKETACSTATADKYVKVNTPPVADAGADLACCVGLESSFDASTSSDPDKDQLTYTWDMGDGTTVNGMMAKHTYMKSGIYNVTLTVDDNSGSSCSKSTAGFTAKVNAKPVPVMDIR